MRNNGFLGTFQRLPALAGLSLIPFASIPTQAQTNENVREQANQIEEVIVNARRVTERLQDIPVSVTSLDQEMLASQQVTSLYDIGHIVPGLSLSRTPVPGGGLVAIRGVTNPGTGRGASDNAIGYYLDGVILARGRGVGTDVLDLARVEVLRGPQGTLFGRNSSAGAINFITNTPRDSFEASVNVLAGSYGRKRARAVVNVPIAEDVAVRLGVQRNEDEGDVKNKTTSVGHTVAGSSPFSPVERFNGYEADSFLARLRIGGSGSFMLDYKFDYNETDDRAGANQLIGFPASAFADLLGSILPLQEPGAVPVSFDRLSRLNENAQSILPITNYGHLLTLDYQFNDNFSLKSINSYRRLKSPGNFGLDGGDWKIPLQTGDFVSFCVSCTLDQENDQEQYSSELQVLFESGNVNAIAGLYYFEEEVYSSSPFQNGKVIPESPAVYTPATTFLDPVQGGLGDFAIGEIAEYTAESYAGYGHLEYALTDRLNLSGGLRYTRDEKTQDDLRSFGTGKSDYNFSEWTWDASVDYKLTPDQLLYAKYATGFVSGGIVSSLPYKTEKAETAEIGLKSEFFDRKLRINAAAYYTWLDDRQATVVSLDPTTNPTLEAAGFSPPYPLGVLVYNVPGTTEVKGFELETSYSPLAGLYLSANFSYNDVEEPVSVRPRSSERQFSFIGRYDTVAFSNGSYLSFQLDGNYRSHYAGSGLQTGAVFSGEVPPALRPGYSSSAEYLAALDDATKQGDYWLFNARASWLDIPVGDYQAQVSAFVRNLADEDGLLYAANYGFHINGAYERPRNYGIEFTVDF